VSRTVVDHGTTYIIGPGGVVVGSQTISLPTGFSSLTTITTNGVTMTFGQQRITTTSSSSGAPTPSEVDIVIGGTTYPIRTSSSTVVDDGITYVIVSYLGPPNL
jgi:hypothetical protein